MTYAELERDTQLPEPVRVQFGAREDDSMPLSWAEKVLTWLKNERPQVFAAAMTEAVFGIEAKRGRGQ